MKKKLLSDESGVTLLEVLVALAILTLLSSITFGVLTTTIKHKDKAQSHINLRQEANIIVSTLRQQHQLQQETYTLCYNNLLNTDKITFAEISLSNSMVEINKEQQCAEISPTNDLKVVFTLADHHHNTFEIDTIVAGFQTSGSHSINIEIPELGEEPPGEEPGEDIYDFLLEENIFVYGSDFGVFGSTPVIGTPQNKLGTILINNYNKKNLTFTGNNQVTVHRIYIDKRGNQVVFNSSTKLGRDSVTELVNIKGDVILNNGAAEINGRTIIIDGKTSFLSSAKMRGTSIYLNGNVSLTSGGSEINGDTIVINGNLDLNGSGRLQGKKVYISGNVTFRNWSDLIRAEELYVAGSITYVQPGNVSATIRPYVAKVIPNMDIAPFDVMPPLLKEDRWYRDNGYVSGGVLNGGMKVFANSYSSTSYNHNNLNNVVVVSKGDITITGLGDKGFRGVLIAPQGKVTFGGAFFEGVVIARDGFTTLSNPSVTYNNIENYFSNKNELPVIWE